MPDPMRVIIIGGGLGGLCLAQGLHRAGGRVAVYERDATSAIRQQGYRIHIDSRSAGGLHRCLPERLYELFLATSGMGASVKTIAARVVAAKAACAAPPDRSRRTMRPPGSYRPRRRPSR